MQLLTDNKFLVARLDDTVIASNVTTPVRLEREDAINLAAWLLHIAQPSRFELATLLVDIENAQEGRTW